MNSISMKHPFARAGVIAALLAGCATPQPIPEMSQPQSSGLAIDLTLRAPISVFSNKPAQVYFAKIDNPDGLLQQQIIRSNFVKDGRAYLLNARPGTYAAVGAFFLPPMQASRATYTTYFSKELVERSKVTIRENDFVFTGSYVVETSVGLDGADEVQTHYKNVIAPGEATGMLAMSFGGAVHYRGTLRERKNDEQTRREFVRNAKEDLAGSGWAARIEYGTLSGLNDQAQPRGSSSLTAEEGTLERAKKLLAILEAAEAGQDAGVSPKTLTERLGQAEQDLAAHLRTHPSDVEALIVSARLDRFRQVLEPVALSRGQEPADPKAAYAPAHEKLNRALALQPNNAEARYWKARLYGLRHPVFRQGRLNYATSDLGEAIKHSKEAVKLEPANDVYREALALYLVEDQKSAEAIDVMRSVVDKQRLAYLLLNDWEAVPIPKTATLSPVDSESFAQQQMARGRFQGYPQLRVRFFVVPTSAIKIEEFYSTYWDRFKFVSQGEPQKAEKGEMRLFAQHFIKVRDQLRPTGPDSKIPDQPSGIFLSVVELRGLPVERRRQTPAGFDMPSGVGDTFCYLIVVNYRPSK